MFKKILGNVQEETGKCFKDPRECLRKFLGIFGKISDNVLGNLPEDFGECFWFETN